MPLTLVKDPEEPSSVTGRVLITFLDALALEEGYGDVAKRLRESLLAQPNMSERALRAALFDSPPP